MRRGERFADDQAEIALSDVAVEQIEALTDPERADVLADIARLAADPGGKHPLGRPLTGWNTAATLSGHQRIVYRATPHSTSTGLIEVLCLGPRTAEKVYDIAKGLVETGLLTDDEATQLWDTLELLDVIAERAGLDGWDYAPPAAPPWLISAAVKLGVLDRATASVMSQPELEAAMEAGYGPDHQPDPAAALQAALNASRPGVAPHQHVTAARAGPRCGKYMPRAKMNCIRSKGHPGACRAAP